MPLKTGVIAMVLALVCAGAVAAFALLGGPPEPIPATKAAAKPETGSLVRSDPDVEPWREETVDPIEAENEVPEPEPEPTPEYEPRPVEFPEATPIPSPEPEPVAQPEPEPEPESEPTVQVASPRPPPDPPEVEAPKPANEPEPVDGPKPYELPDGAIMALTADALGLREVPVFDSTAAWALKYGVGHATGTSLPWSGSPHRNVYVAGHRVGFPGTASDRVFGNLENLGEGDEVVLRDGEGSRYRYRVAESFVASPEDGWVKGRVRGEDLLTLQTCVGPNFSERLIVRAERV